MFTGLVMITSACGSPSAPTGQAPASLSSPATATATTGGASASVTGGTASADAGRCGDEHYIGSMAWSGQGVAVAEQLCLGDLQYGDTAAGAADAPSDVFAACGYGDVTGTTVWAGGTVTLKYLHGAVADTIGLIGATPGGDIAGGPSDEDYALQVNGTWECTSGPSEPMLAVFNVQPGYAGTLPVYVIFPQFLTNQQPRLSQAFLNRYSWPGVEVQDQPSTGEPLHYRFTGPQAAACRGADVPTGKFDFLLPFARLPFRESGLDGPISCSVL